MKPPEPGQSDREVVARLIDDAHTVREAPVGPVVRVRVSGLVTQVTNVAPDYSVAHVVVIEPFLQNSWMNLVSYAEVPGITGCYLRAWAWVRRN